MAFSPFLDGATALFSALIGGAGILSLPAVILVEAFVLVGLFQWGSFGTSLRDSFLMNLVSTVVGVVGVVFWGPYFWGFDRPEPAPGSYFLHFLALFALSVLVEAGILWMLHDQTPARQIWTASLAVNIVSYTALFLILGSLL